MHLFVNLILRSTAADVRRRWQRRLPLLDFLAVQPRRNHLEVPLDGHKPELVFLLSLQAVLSVQRQWHLQIPLGFQVRP